MESVRLMRINSTPCFFGFHKNITVPIAVLSCDLPLKYVLFPEKVICVFVGIF